MELNPKEIVKHLEGKAQYKGELKDFYDLMKKLPDIKHSKFYSVYPDYQDVITQGDVISGLKVVDLPNGEISPATCMVFSNSCDIDTTNVKKFASRVVYAPLLRLDGYENMLKEATDDKGKREWTDEQIEQHISDIRMHKVNQIFYLPSSKYNEAEGIVFFDRINNADNNSVSRGDLKTTRMLSLSSYGWYLFLYRFTHAFAKMTDETVELRFNPSI